MKFLRSIGLIAVILMSIRLAASALDIPLTGQTGKGGGGTAVAYVDMERIFQIYPQTQAAKEDYAVQLQKKRDQLAQKEKELDNLKNKIAVLEATFKGGQSAVSGSTSSAAGVAVSSSTPLSSVDMPQSLAAMKKDLEDRQAELEDTRKQAEQDLQAFQSKQSQMILGKIYEALKELAAEEQVTLVVDKSSILYGSATIDLTDKLQQRVRGY